MLHTVNKSPYASKNLENAMRFMQSGEHLLLIEDGVYAALAGGSFEKTLGDLASRLKVYVLEEDAKARGINVSSKVQMVNYAGFVDLTVAHKVNNWL